jgi:peptidoglycan/LPS O-acetylase OafA/YrhL
MLNPNRFVALDGLRAVAAPGVLWIHCWSAYGAPRFALGGNGVDLFFALSGFCMYYFYGRNNTFSYADFGSFIKKRWIRLSPAFYTACLVYMILRFYSDHSFPLVTSAITSLFYLNGVFANYTPQAILWTLTVEWQFYIIVPFLLFYQNRLSFSVAFLTITTAILTLAIVSVLVLKRKSDILTDQILFRYFEFMWGVLAARILLVFPQYRLKYRALILLVLIATIYIGRICISRPVLKLSVHYYNLYKLLGFNLMALGFSGLIYLSLTSKRFLKTLLGNRVIGFVGQVSFSFYLWHALINGIVGAQLVKVFGYKAGLTVPLANFVISTAILVPLSALSFKYLERPFMARSSIK